MSKHPNKFIALKFLPSLMVLAWAVVWYLPGEARADFKVKKARNSNVFGNNLSANPNVETEPKLSGSPTPSPKKQPSQDLFKKPPLTQPPKLPGLRGDILRSRPTILTTAHHLQQGEVISSLRYRQFILPGTDAENGLTGQPTFGFSWGITDNLEITVDAQTFDNSQPGKQGAFLANRASAEGSSNFFQQFTFQAKQRLWQNSTGNQALSAVLSVPTGVRYYEFIDPSSGALVEGKNNDNLVVSVELPFTVAENRWQLTLSPKLVFFPEDNAMYYRRMPIEDSGSFGLNFGLAGGISYEVNPRLIVWGDMFIPLTGNNTINRDTGFPARSVAFNAGLRYLVNPRLATELFISNALGNTGPASILTDRENIAVGAGVIFLPGFTSANRQYPRSFSSRLQPPPASLAGFSFFDGGTVAQNQLLPNLQVGSQGILTAIRYGLLDDLEVGIYMDLISGEVDESELGLSGKIRFLHQADGDLFTLSGALNFGKTTNSFSNFLSGNPNELSERGLKERGFSFTNETCLDNGGEIGNNGECFVISLAFSLHYQFENGSAVWLTPTLGFVQRNGLEIAGFNLGGSVLLSRNLSLIAEAGLNFTEGNALIGNERENVIPWSLGLRWDAGSFLGSSPALGNLGPQVEVYLTNRVGYSVFQSLRVREDNSLGVGFGLVWPVQF
ncbi:hypothetical protein NG798_14460 [Ancylothrix sp. C2]|uniref:hypothetical protein n=1 Tax=Ancylothrix sp. D3o TaxID=2953691 RepID=UPI0021BB99D7|nr:hypothetical protein [Ancylothrix sp. D3o]MCT7950998.1 hypothetical protein [Ancylothrix sp. D3o]